MPTETTLPATRLPVNPKDWQDKASEVGLATAHLHDGTVQLESASNITYEQFLLLHVLWQPLGKPKKLNPSVDLKCREKARNHLNSLPCWARYISSLTKTATELCKTGYKGLEIFSLVRHQQIEAEGVRPVGESVDKTDFSPLNDRRPRRAMAQSQTARGTAIGTPTRSTGSEKLFASMSNLALQETPTSLRATQSITPSSLSTQSTESSSATLSPRVGEIAAEYDAICDEQIVNSALHLFLNAVLFYHEDVAAYWSLRRERFVAEDRRSGLPLKMYSAKVDGVLLDKRDTVLSIVEVKPFQRFQDGKTESIQMQEAAQVAAWINQCPPENLDEMREEGKTEKRILISQDRDEIYVTTATFSAAYVDYIRDVVSSEYNRTEQFLRLKPYGSFTIGDMTQMRRLGEFVLAFALEKTANS